MPFDSSGNFTPLITFVDGQPATAGDQNSQDSDIAAGLSDCMTRDGLAPATAPQNFGGFRLEGVGPGSASTDAANLGQLQAFVPPGVVFAYAGASAPTGYLLCFGQDVSRATFAALFDAVGTTYGPGDGSTTFTLPDCRGRVEAGQDNMGGVAANRLTTAGSGVDGATLGAVGGQQAHVLTGPEMPSHTHVATVTDPGHTHSYVASNTTTVTAFTAATNVITPPNTAQVSGSSVTGITVANSNTGAGNSHNNVQPVIVFTKIIKT